MGEIDDDDDALLRRPPRGKDTDIAKPDSSPLGEVRRGLLLLMECKFHIIMQLTLLNLLHTPTVQYLIISIPCLFLVSLRSVQFSHSVVSDSL